MKVLNKKLLTDFTTKHADAVSSIAALVSELQSSDWKTPVDIKQSFPKASIITGEDIVFNIRNNNYRVWVIVNYQEGIVLVKNVGTHKEYDNWRIKS